MTIQRDLHLRADARPSRLAFAARIVDALRVPLAFVPVITSLLAIDGCTSMACIEWSSSKGACPSREDALVRFGGKSCVSDVVSVDSDGTADETACCYEVTKRGKNDPGCSFDDNISPPGGATGGGVSCGGCAAFRDGTAVELCDGSVDIFNNLSACMCSGACQAACADGSCSLASDNADCQACVVDVNVGCGLQSQACDGDI